MDTMQYFQEEYDNVTKAISQVAELSIDSIKSYRHIITTQKDFVSALIDILPEFDVDKIKLLFDEYVSELNLSVENFKSLSDSINDVYKSMTSSHSI